MTAYHLTPPSSGFRCVLDAQPDFRVPRRLRHVMTPQGTEQWSVNPTLQFSSSGRCPDREVPYGDVLASPDAMAWLRDPVTSVSTSFVLGKELSPIVEGLQPESDLHQSLPAHVIASLCASGILYNRCTLKERQTAFREMIRRARREACEGYTCIDGVLHPFTLGAARTYFRRIIRRGAARYGDSQTAHRWVTNNEPLARFIHHQLTPIVETVVDAPIKPSYVYFASYERGADLPWHKDREQCEYSISMLIDYAPEPESQSPWPLLLETTTGVVSVHQKLGDVLIYRGRDLPHARERIPDGHTSTHLFFHYVPRDFQGTLE